MQSTRSLDQKPPTRYAKSGQLNIAYQVLGSGSTDIIYIPGWISNIDLMWDCPELVSFLSKLAKRHRVILFDKRGTGLSDRIVELSTIEERMDDIRAVMDAVQSEKAILFGHSEGGSVSALFAATYPNRTIALITFGVFARRKYSDDYPWAPTDEERQKVYDMIENHWGSGDMGLEDLAPSKKDDAIFMEWLERYFRSGASPSAALVLTKMNTQVDIVEVLPTIQVPTLLLQRTNDIDVKIEEGRFIADRIKGAVFREFEGEDHLFWVGNTDEVLNEMFEFIQELKPFKSTSKKLIALGIAELSSFQNNSENPSLFMLNESLIREKHIEKYRGHLHVINNNEIIAYFDGPIKAIQCFLELQESFLSVNMNLKCGIHLADCSFDHGILQEGYALQFTNKIKTIAKADEILVSQTVKNLVPEAELQFSKIKQHSDPSIFGHVYQVRDRYRKKGTFLKPDDLAKLKHGPLLDNVLQVINANIDNEIFGIEILCREVGLGERQLQRKIKALTNKSPNQLIRSVRLHKARALLNSNYDGIAQVAFQTGFNNPSYFAKCFKSEFGVSPSEIISTRV